MKNTFFFLILLLIFSFKNYAQKQSDTYTGAVGVQVYPLAITAKYDNGNEGAEGSFASSGRSWRRMTGLYERENILVDNSIKFIWGIGADFMVLNPNWKVSENFYGSDGAIGIAGIIGVDKKIIAAPIDVSASWQPNVNIYGINKAFILNFAFAARLAF